ncbi:Dabb family protein [Ferrimicrobium sp.]|uniref:Dabb family protein n=1 Tax=Ferrimicrobium sp. TaxID=2926050 RepID=UPI002621E775|nr:Dabb family protein [Ferrimicrobium sp.]
MIRNVVMMKLKPDYDPSLLNTLLARLHTLNCPGTLSYTAAVDAGLRSGNWTVAIVADFIDVDSYRGYDENTEHNQIRAELAPLIEEIARVQFVL